MDSDDLSTTLWRLGLQLKGIGELISSQHTGGAPLDDEDCKLGTGLIVKELGTRVLETAEQVTSDRTVTLIRKKGNKRK